jgi:hypothetical protein
MRATVHFSFHFHPVPDDAAITHFAAWREGLDRALERIKIVGGALRRYLERFVVLVPAGFTFSHGDEWVGVAV